MRHDSILQVWMKLGIYHRNSTHKQQLPSSPINAHEAALGQHLSPNTQSAAPRAKSEHEATKPIRSAHTKTLATMMIKRHPGLGEQSVTPLPSEPAHWRSSSLPPPPPTFHDWSSEYLRTTHHRTILSHQPSSHTRLVTSFRPSQIKPKSS
ncbi:hypothetical protein MHUMG1_08149 [Metarhizium humberi]|uniref:Uncharacterized protein n=1 Tax=Metarhizium humberi TaxID=2596975 RepID=A0A9P8M923_9HYPO|nr:hypothetical protein MHUMG1_08149 [Metarhizium humberi]